MADNRGPWIIAVAIVLAAALAVGAWAYFRERDQTCADWQARYRRAVEDHPRYVIYSGQTSAEDIKADQERRLAAALELAGPQPEGCPFPDPASEPK